MTNSFSDQENQEEVTFDEFCEEWLREFAEGNLSPFEKGQKFALKLVTQWLGVNDDDEDLVLCDGSGDGGIDIAYLHRAEAGDGEQADTSVDRGYLVSDSKQIRESLQGASNSYRRRPKG